SAKMSGRLQRTSNLAKRSLVPPPPVVISLNGSLLDMPEQCHTEPGVLDSAGAAPVTQHPQTASWNTDPAAWSSKNCRARAVSAMAPATHSLAPCIESASRRFASASAHSILGSSATATCLPVDSLLHAYC